MITAGINTGVGFPAPIGACRDALGFPRVPVVCLAAQYRRIPAGTMATGWISRDQSGSISVVRRLYGLPLQWPMMAGANYLLVLTLLNPLWGVQSVSERPVFNLLLAYGLPPLMASLACRYFKPRFQRVAAGIAAIDALIFISMEIRHLWQGQLAIRWPSSDRELYTYSAVWLAITFAAILYASRRQIDSLYRGGMALLIVVIAKLFLIDMAGLEGLWRVASFMGLGLSLLGLAFLYQRTSIHNTPLNSQESAEA
jgi:uncharacterized membrane protein